MKRINLLFMSLLCVWISATAQVGQQSQEPVDSIKNIGYMDSLFQELPEVMITGERPIVKAEQGKLVYDVPRLVGNLPVDNAYDVVKNLPGIVNMNNSLMLGGQEVTVVINGKVTTLSAEQLDALLKSIPVSRIEKAEVMYSAPARYQVRGPMINLILAPGTGQASSLQGELYTAFNQHHYESLAERGSLLYSGRKFSADLLYSYSYDRDRRITEKEALHTLWQQAGEQKVPRGMQQSILRMQQNLGMQSVGSGKKYQLLIWRAAAIFLLAVSSVSIYLMLEKDKPQKDLVECFIPTAEIRELTLPDGTRVMLNSRSTLLYPEQFAGKTRSVYLIGEANFQVKPDEKHPFIVKDNDFQI